MRFDEDGFVRWCWLIPGQEERDAPIAVSPPARLSSFRSFFPDWLSAPVMRPFWIGAPLES